MQIFCGIDHPIAGVVLKRRLLMSPATVRRDDYGRLGLEFEIAVRIGSDMPAAARTAATVEPCIDGVCAAIELVDDRGADYGSLDVRSLVADNSWNGGIVISNFVTRWPTLGCAWEGDARRIAARRRIWARHSRPPLQFGGLAQRAPCQSGRSAEERSDRDDRECDENSISDSSRKLSFQPRRARLGRGPRHLRESRAAETSRNRFSGSDFAGRFGPVAGTTRCPGQNTILF
jgi:hypothetical protein